jgi:hypothetical protein
VITTNILQRARTLDKRNAKMEKEATRLLNKMAKKEFSEMAILNDHILAEGVENLESESGRTRFFENLKTKGLSCSKEKLEDTVAQMLRDQGGDQVETLDDFRIDDAKEDSQMVNLLSIIKDTGGQEAEETQALMTNQIQTDCIYHYSSEAYEKMESKVRLPQLLVMQVERVELDLKHLEVNQPKGDEKVLLKIRKKTVERVYRMTMAVSRSQSKMTEAERKDKEKVDEDKMAKRYAKAKKEMSKRLKPTVKITTQSERKMRTRKEVDYTEEAKTHPNWKRDQKESKLNLVNRHCRSTRVTGSGRLWMGTLCCKEDNKGE